MARVQSRHPVNQNRCPICRNRLSATLLPLEIKQEQQMMKLMGFAGFDTTKGKGVEDNKRGPAKGAVSKHKEREYRQYMNRRGTWL